MAEEPRNIILQDRDRLVLDFIARYELATHQALARAPFFAEANAGEDVVKSVTKRLRAAGYIQSFPLYGKRTYDQLTLKGAAQCGARPRLAKPLRTHTKNSAYAILAFCCKTMPIRVRLTSDELMQRFPSLYRNGERPQYFIDQSEGYSRLVYIQVDHTRSGRYDRIFGRIHRAVAKRCDRPEYVKLIDDQRFAIALVTCTEEKAERLRHEAMERNLTVPVMFEYVEGLVNLMMPPARRRPHVKAESKTEKKTSGGGDGGTHA